MLRPVGILLLAALLAGCNAERRRATLETLRSAVEPPALPADTIPEVLDYAADLQVDLSEMAKLPIGVLYSELAPNDSVAALAADTLPVGAGDSVALAYQAWLADGTLVDSAEVVTRVGAGDVLVGIDAALPGMKPGGRRKLVLSPGLAFGVEGRDLVPPNAVVVVDLELRGRIR